MSLPSQPAGQPRILVATSFDPAGLEVLRQDAQVDVQLELSPEELEEVIAPYHALIVSSEMRVPDRTIEYAYHLQVIGVTGSSLDHLNVSAARAQDVEVINVPDPRTLAMAEETMRLILSLIYQDRSAGLARKTLGIIGFGGTGHEVARRARAFDMQVIVHQPRLTPELALEAGVENREMHALMQEADFITLHVPPSTETRHLIAAGELALCRPSAFLINTSHPEAVHLDALLNALETGQLAGAALLSPPDAPEPFPPRPHPRLLVAPQVGPTRGRAKRETAVSLARQVRAALSGRRVGNPLALKVVPLAQVVPHEHTDPPRVDDLVERLKVEETLVNPPVVVEWEDHYIVLDGATRVTALKRLGYPHTVVQLISPTDPRLSLHTWYHAIYGPSTGELMEALHAVEGCEITAVRRELHYTALESGEAICSLVTPEEDSFLVYPRPDYLPLEALNRLVDAYTGLGGITRTLNTKMVTLKTEVPNVSLLAVFPQFKLQAVLRAAVSGRLLPAGITRFLIPGRVLRLHADLAYLRSDRPLEQKNQWLNDFLAEKISRRRVRFYQEPVVLLDE